MTLTFEAVGQSGLNIGSAAEDIYELDGINFSSTPAPEPASLSLLLLAAAPLLTRPSQRH